jgi:shikimate kinase
MERTWILVGMMGAGKSSVGRLLAERAGREFADTDTILIGRLGRTIPQIFRLYGEQAFRDHETSVLRNLSPGRFVLATGGGTVLRPENWNEMRRLGTTLYLQASPQTLIGRLERTRYRRPLLVADDWQERIVELLDRRRPFYEQADHVVNVDGLSTEETAEKVYRTVEPE